MNKSISKISILLICGALIFTGCANASGAINSSQTSNENDNNVEKSNVIENENKENTNQKGQRMKTRPDMFGKVKSIIGNEVVLELIEIPQIETKGKNDKDKAKNVLAVNGDAEGDRPGPRSEGGAGRRELNLTGETATILIPVGVPITTRSSGEVKNLEIADIYEGSMLQIWTNEEENITRVAIMQGR